MLGWNGFGRASLVVASLMLSACALWSNWHWEKAGASAADYERDEIACKQRSYSGTDGMVNNVAVRRMHACLESRGWHKVQD